VETSPKILDDLLKTRVMLTIVGVLLNFSTTVWYHWLNLEFWLKCKLCD